MEKKWKKGGILGVLSADGKTEVQDAAPQGAAQEVLTNRELVQEIATGASVPAGAAAPSQGRKEDKVENFVKEALEFFLSLWKCAKEAIPDPEKKCPVPLIPGELLANMDSKAQSHRATATAGTHKERMIREKVDRWLAQESEAQVMYPSLDLEEEMKDPRFVELLDCGLDVRTAFEIVHKDQILSASMHYAAGEMARRLRSETKSENSRPTENGGSHGPAVSKPDVSRMSRKERKELVQRVRMGEIIRF